MIYEYFDVLIDKMLYLILWISYLEVIINDDIDLKKIINIFIK